MNDMYLSQRNKKTNWGMKGLSNKSTRMAQTCTYFYNRFLNVYHHHGDQQGTDSGIQGLLLCQHKWQHLHNH